MEKLGKYRIQAKVEKPIFCHFFANFPKLGLCFSKFLNFWVSLYFSWSTRSRQKNCLVYLHGVPLQEWMKWLLMLQSCGASAQWKARLGKNGEKTWRIGLNWARLQCSCICSSLCCQRRYLSICLPGRKARRALEAASRTFCRSASIPSKVPSCAELVQSCFPSPFRAGQDCDGPVSHKSCDAWNEPQCSKT